MGKSVSGKQKVHNTRTSPRASAIELLIKCNDGAFANEIVPPYLSRSSYDQRERALVTKIVYSTLRQQIRIDHILTRRSKRPLNKVDVVALNALRSVVSQLLDDGDAHGIVNETVNAMPSSVKGFVNAIARTLSDDHKNGSLIVDENDRIAVSMPKWIYDEVCAVFSDSSSAFTALNTPAVVTVAPLTSDVDIEGARRGCLISDSFLLGPSGNIAEIEAIKTGKAIVVDQGSQLVVQCVDATSSMNVLDICAAPGGKSFLLSRKSFHVVSVDQTLSRMRKLMDTKMRTSITNVSPIVADARALPVEIKFDRILVDAPCSGLGVLRRRPDARLRLVPTTLDELMELQKEILSSAIDLLAPGAKLIYSVCTFSRKETLGIDDWLEQRYPELIAEPLIEQNPHFVVHGRGALLPPGPENDSMFVLRLVAP